MRQLTKDRFELTSKSVAIIGGIISAFVLIATMQGGIAQRSREHRWNQARLAMELVDAMLSDGQSFDAMRMIDWDARSYEISSGRMEVLTPYMKQLGSDDALDLLQRFASSPPASSSSDR